MRAVVMTRPGDPSVLQLQELPEPERESSTSLLIRLKAAGVNPIDTKQRHRGTLSSESGPAILGCDAAGVVEAVGSDVSQFRPGDEVYFCNGGLGSHPGNYAEYTTIDERFAARKPKSLSFTEAAAVPLVALTAWESLFDLGQLQGGQRVLIHAGAGGVGHLAIQLAHQVGGARVATTVSSEEKAAFVRDLGAESVILYKQTDFVEAIRDWTENEGVDLALDSIGPETLQRSFPAIRFYGMAVTLLDPTGADFKEARARNLRLGLEVMLTPMRFGLTAAQVHQKEILERCARLFDEGKLRITLTRTFPLAEAAEAHRLLEAGHAIGKIALTTE